MTTLHRGSAARAYYEASLPLFRLTGDVRGLAQALVLAGRGALRDGDVDHARDRLVEGLACWHDLGISAGVLRCIDDLATVAVLAQQSTECS